MGHRIRRVKCDEQKPECSRCVRARFRCDGRPLHTGTVARPSNLSIYSYAIPFSIPGSQSDRRLLHFYCVQGAIDLAGYTPSELWRTSILQHAHRHSVVRQAVIALSSWQVSAMCDDTIDAVGSSGTVSSEDHVIQYGKALRGLRRCIAHPGNSPLERSSILVCCLLFFCYENGRGDPHAALTHLDNGLRILKHHEPRDESLHGAPEGKPEALDPHLVQLFHRLDCQATLFDDGRTPLSSIPGWDHVWNGFTTKHAYRIRSVADAHTGLAILQARVARLLTSEVQYKDAPVNELPERICVEKRHLAEWESIWHTAMEEFISTQTESVQLHMKIPSSAPRQSPEPEIARQIRTLTIHYRLCQMFLRSSFPPNPTIWTASPNLKAHEILTHCEALADCVPGRSAANPPSTFPKLSCETGLLAPLFMLAMKCSNVSVRQRAISQLQKLSGRKEGLYDAEVVQRILVALRTRADEVEAHTTTRPGERRDYDEWVDWLEIGVEQEQPVLPSVQPLESMEGTAFRNEGGLVQWVSSMDMSH